MKLSNRNILIILVFCLLGLLIAFSFQHGFNSSFYRELATDSGFDADYGGSSSSGGGGGSSSSGSSGSSSRSANISPFASISLLIGTAVFVLVVLPVFLSYDGKFKDKRLIYGLLFGLLITIVIACLFTSLLFFVFDFLISTFTVHVFVSVLITILIFVLVFSLMMCIKNSIVTKNALKKLNCFSQVMSDPSIVNEAYNIYVKVQEAWSKNDVDSLRSLISDAMYNTYSVQIQTMIRKHRRNEMSNFKFVKGCIHDYKSYDDKDVYVITLQVLCKDYLVDSKTNKKIKGSRRRNNYIYSLTFEKYKDVDIKECPNCKAPLPTFCESVKCSYCGSIINKKSTNMVLIDKKMLLQR